MRSSATPTRLARLVFAVTIVACSAQAEPFRFVRLGELPGGTYFQVANAISPDGSIVVGCCYATAPFPAPSQAVLWSEATGIVGLGQPPEGAWSSTAYGVSSDGSTVIGYFQQHINDSNRIEILRWTPAGGMVNLGDLPGGLVLTGAHALTPDGQFFVGSGYATGGSRGFRRGPTGGFQILAPAAGNASGANDLSDDATLVVGWSGSSMIGDTATVWDAAGTPVALGRLPGATSSYATDVSGDGVVIVGSSGVSGEWNQSFHWTVTTGLQQLPSLPTGFYGDARATNGDGTVIVGTQAIGDRDQYEWDYRAFVWDKQHGTRDLNALVEAFGVDLGDWQLVTANAVSADGRSIVGTLQRGFGQGANRQFQAYYVHLPPECSNGLDDDADGAVDYPADLQCASESGLLERAPRSCGLFGPELLALPVWLAARRRRLARA
jgi:uncharacterized membrane protein